MMQRRRNAAVHRQGGTGAGAVWQEGQTSQTGLCFSTSSFNPVRKKHIPMHKTLPKKSAGCAPPVGRAHIVPFPRPEWLWAGSGSPLLGSSTHTKTPGPSQCIKTHKIDSPKKIKPSLPLALYTSPRGSVSVMFPWFLLCSFISQGLCAVAKLFSSQSDINAPPLLKELDVINFYH